MTPETKRTIGNAILAVAVVILLLQIAGMAGVLPKLIPSRGFAPFVFVLILVAAPLRRARRAPKPTTSGPGTA